MAGLSTLVTLGQQPVIAVCGAGACGAPIAALAEAVGRHIAQAGATLVCGGLGGVMEAACRGAHHAGGLTIGILPGASRHEANPFVHIAIPTAMGHARNVILVQSADVVIAISGKYGTLSEIALARACGRQVIGVQTWDLGTDTDATPDTPHIIPASTPEEAVTLALRYRSPHP